MEPDETAPNHHFKESSIKKNADIVLQQLGFLINAFSLAMAQVPWCFREVWFDLGCGLH